jgi:hypothetical protein
MLDIYNYYYNLECASLAHGSPISNEELQAITLNSMVNAFKHNNLSNGTIQISEILALANNLIEQGKNSYVEVPNY